MKECEMDDMGITASIKWDKIGSWIARTALLLIAYFLLRLVDQIDNTTTELEKTTKTVYEIKGEINVLQYQIRDLKSDVDNVRQNQ